MPNSVVEDGEIKSESDESVKNVVQMLMAETNLLRQNITEKMNSFETLKTNMEGMQEAEKTLRIKLFDESEHARTENEYLHKALSLLEEQAYVLCEENRQKEIIIENHREKQAEMESEIKKYSEYIKTNHPNVSLNSLKNLNENSRNLLEYFNSLLSILELQRKSEECVRNDLQQTKQTVESLKLDNESVKMENDGNLILVECLQLQINAQETELSKLETNLATCKTQMAVNLDLERNETNRLNRTIVYLKHELSKKKPEYILNSYQEGNLEKSVEIQRLKDKVQSLSTSNAVYLQKITRLKNFMQKFKHHGKASVSLGRKIKSHEDDHRPKIINEKPCTNLIDAELSLLNAESIEMNDIIDRSSMPVAVKKREKLTVNKET